MYSQQITIMCTNTILQFTKQFSPKTLNLKEYILFDFVCMKYQKRQNCNGRKHIGGAQVQQLRTDSKGGRGNFEGDRTLMCIDCGSGYTIVHNHQNFYDCTFKWERFTVCK